MPQFLIPNAYSALFCHAEENFDMEKLLIYVCMKTFKKELMQARSDGAIKVPATEILLDLQYSQGKTGYH